ncbi:MAG: 4-(cytidine 5'-diphospho)-2-C-methyl-D-erythritol kinase [Sphingopyxis sp.]|nr:4-(cytidine 5'-diphospho)-2-C-methyl-D-erythritol kinase [Sphingopyxis sp.]
MWRETAYAKINLALHVRARRADGYHDIETLFAFVDAGDALTAVEADQDSLTITGEFAAGLSAGPDNLVLRALASMRNMAGGESIPPVAISLEKNLPVAAGLGGGSADAAAVIRMLDREFHICGDGKELVIANSHLGADVGACIVSETRRGTGTGWELAEVDDSDVKGLALLLINPYESMATGPVFAGWDGQDRGALREGTALAAARAGRNDLEPPAIALCEEIDEVLAVLRAQLPVLARMSGSGASCFALFRDAVQRDAAAKRIARDHPEWWQMAGALR